MFSLSRSVKNTTASWTALEEEEDDVDEEVVEDEESTDIESEACPCPTEKENSPNSRVMNANMVSYLKYMIKYPNNIDQIVFVQHE